jgi:hypothetical protein
MRVEEVKTLASTSRCTMRGVGRLRLQAEGSQQSRQSRQRLLGLATGPAHHDQVIGEPDQHPVTVIPRPVQPVQVDVTHDGAEHAALCAVPGYVQRWPAGPGSGRIGGRTLRIISRWLSEAGEPVEEAGVLVPFGQVAGDDALAGDFEGFAFGLGRGLKDVGWAVID